METGDPPDESDAEPHRKTSSPPDLPALVIVIGSSPIDAAMLDELLASGAVVLLASRSEQVRSWLAGDLVLRVLPQPINPDDAIIRVDHLSIDPREHRAFWGDRPLLLSERELSMLKALAEEPRRAWSFSELQEKVWLSTHYGDRALVKAAIRRLRRKLRVAGVAVKIASVKGFGFRLSSP